MSRCHACLSTGRTPGRYQARPICRACATVLRRRGTAAEWHRLRQVMADSISEGDRIEGRRG